MRTKRKSTMKRFISVFLSVVMLLSIITATPFTSAANTNSCGEGGIIASPIQQGLTGAHVINGNELRNNTNAVLDINVS